MLFIVQALQRLSELFCCNESGAIMTEYGVILALIAFLVLFLSNSIGGDIGDIGDVVQQAILYAGEP